jgi:hypothetical protein
VNLPESLPSSGTLGLAALAAKSLVLRRAAGACSPWKAGALALLSVTPSNTRTRLPLVASTPIWSRPGMTTGLRAPCTLAKARDSANPVGPGARDRDSPSRLCGQQHRCHIGHRRRPERYPVAGRRATAVAEHHLVLAQYGESSWHTRSWLSGSAEALPVLD